MNIMLDSALNNFEIMRKVNTSIRLVSDNMAEKATFENIAIIGLGYVGLPLAVCLAEKFQYVRGVDISERRVSDLLDGHDATNEIGAAQLLSSGLEVSTGMTNVADASFFVVTVPTPITDSRQPDLSPLQSACDMIGPYLKKGDVVVFESTVYPGVTEDFCGPILEKLSGLKAGKDFGLGYSPERINPGDKVNTVENVIKIVSGDTPETLKRVEAVYNMVIKAGLHAAPTIKVAEAAKVLENTQRDINIALMNEMSLICDKIGVDTRSVIDAAATKWNFIPFTPGLVGGHCIGVDPYYLASLAEKVGHHPQVILAGRRTNDGMVGHIVNATMRRMVETGKAMRNMRVGVFGVTFKENVPDIRNSKSVELVNALRDYGITPMVNDTHCSAETARHVGIELANRDDMFDLDVLILATPHADYAKNPQFLNHVNKGGILIDVRGIYRNHERQADLTYWSL